MIPSALLFPGPPLISATFQPTDEGFHVRDEHAWKVLGGGTSNDTNVWDTETFPEEFQGLLSVEAP